MGREDTRQGLTERGRSAASYGCMHFIPLPHPCLRPHTLLQEEEMACLMNFRNEAERAELQSAALEARARTEREQISGLHDRCVWVGVGAWVGVGVGVGGPEWAGQQGSGVD